MFVTFIIFNFLTNEWPFKCFCHIYLLLFIFTFGKRKQNSLCLSFTFLYIPFVFLLCCGWPFSNLIKHSLFLVLKNLTFGQSECPQFSSKNIYCLLSLQHILMNEEEKSFKTNLCACQSNLRSVNNNFIIIQYQFPVKITHSLGKSNRIGRQNVTSHQHPKWKIQTHIKTLKQKTFDQSHKKKNSNHKIHKQPSISVWKWKRPENVALGYLCDIEKLGGKANKRMKWKGLCVNLKVQNTWILVQSGRGHVCMQCVVDIWYHVDMFSPISSWRNWIKNEQNKCIKITKMLQMSHEMVSKKMEFKSLKGQAIHITSLISRWFLLAFQYESIDFSLIYEMTEILWLGIPLHIQRNDSTRNFGFRQNQPFHLYYAILNSTCQLNSLFFSFFSLYLICALQTHEFRDT